MSRHITPSFDRNLLAKLFRLLGSDNEHERIIATSKIDALLNRYGKTWADVPALLARGSTMAINADITQHVTALGSHNSNEREIARQWLNDLLIRSRKTWNDLTDLLLSPISPCWADGTADSDPPPGFDADFPIIDLVHRLTEYYVALTPTQRVAVT